MILNIDISNSSVSLFKTSKIALYLSKNWFKLFLFLTMIISLRNFLQLLSLKAGERYKKKTNSNFL